MRPPWSIAERDRRKAAQAADPQGLGRGNSASLALRAAEASGPSEVNPAGSEK